MTSTPLHVEFGADNGGIVLNLSEDGFSVQPAKPLIAESFPRIQFKGGPDAGCIEASGRLVWTGDTGKAAGVQFVDLSEHAREQITKWIALETFPEQADQAGINDPSRMTKAAPLASEGSRSAAEVIAELLFPLGVTEEDRGPVQGNQPPHVSIAPYASDTISSQQFSERTAVPPEQIHQPTNIDPSRTTKGAPSAGEGGRSPAELIAELLSPLAGKAEEDRDPVHRDEPAYLLPVAPSTDPRPFIPETPPSSRAAISRMFLVAALTFAAGLVLGYGVLARFSNGAGKSTAERSEASKSPNIVAAKAIRDRAGASSTPDKPPLSLPNPAIARRPAGLSAYNVNDSDVQRPAALARSRPSEPITPHVLAEPRSPRASAYVPQASSQAPAIPQQEKSTAAEQEAMNSLLSRSPESVSPIQTQADQASVQLSRPDTTAPSDSGAAESAFPAVTVTASLGTDALPGDHPRAPESGIAQGELTGPHAVGATSLGHIDPSYVIHAVQPVYPPEARKQHLEGIVELRVVVGTDGGVRSVKLVSGSPLLASAAMDAARQFRYSPAALNGQPIETIQSIDMSFQLKH